MVVKKYISSMLTLGIILIGILFFPITTNATEKREPIKKGVFRVYGEDRYATSTEIANVLKEQREKDKFDNIVVCCGTGFADALAGNFLAVKKEAPILLVNENANILCEYIENNLKEEGIVYILGGNAAVSNEVEETLSVYNVKRIWGETRFETNIEILKEAAVEGEEILVCTAYEYADSLSASATKKPILLVDNNKGRLLNVQEEFLASTNVDSFCVIGGEAAVSKELEDALSQYGNVRRVWGENRYETSVRVAETFFYKPSAVVLTYGKNFPDGLCGGGLAYSMNAPLLLVENSNLIYAKSYISSQNLDNGVILGGSGLISDLSVNQIFSKNEYFEVKNWEDSQNYTIEYVLNGGTNHEDNLEKYTEGQTFLLNSPYKDNYDFKGWYKESNFKTKVEKINATDTGNLKLYAKWNLKALNINGNGMDDMIWSWWYYPQVLSIEEDVYWGYATSEGYCGIAKYNRNTDVISKTALKRSNTVDDHNGLAVTQMTDGRIMCVYAGGHNSDNEIHVRISDKPNDITSFSKDIVLVSSGKTCYGQILQYDGKYYVFYRVNNNKWAYRISNDGEVWEDETILISSGMQYYCRFVPTTEAGLVRVCMCSNPTEKDPRIRMGFLDLESGKMYNSDRETYVGTKNLQYEVFDVLIEPATNKTQRMFDVAISNPESTKILYTEFTSKTGKNDSIYYLYDSGKIQKICEGGKPLWDPKYQLGAAFVGENKIALGRNEAGEDYIELYSYENSQLNLLKEINRSAESSDNRNARPIVDVNGDAVLWHIGYYNIKSYKDFNTSAKMYLVNSDRVIGTSNISNQ